MSLDDFGGPVSRALEGSLRDKVRKHGLVVWLDTNGDYTALVDRLMAARARGALAYAVYAFRGSHLALMRALEGVAGGTQPAQAVIHLPGPSQESVKALPVLELYAAGHTMRPALKTTVTDAAAGQVRPEQLEAFIKRSGLTLEDADAWLAEQVDDAVGGLAAQLRALNPGALLDDLLTNAYIAARVAGPQPADPTHDAALWSYAEARLGLPERWRDATLPQVGPRSARDLAFTMASWALCVEYVHDLLRSPKSAALAPAVGLPDAVVAACRAVATHLRDRQPEFYRRVADETEDRLDDERQAARAEDLGAIDTFRFEEDKVLEAAFAALEGGQYAAAEGWARARTDAPAQAGSFWLRKNWQREHAWALVGDAARLGAAIARAGHKLQAGAAGLEGALEAYAARGAAVDAAHRQMEQRRAQWLVPELTEYERLRPCLDAMRRAWRAWADAWARDFNAVCKASGFVGALSTRQRTLFDDVVRPFTQEAGITAYFVVDALRYEMGQALFERLQSTPSTTAELRARLAELPTVTEVGMNALAPVARAGRLQVAMTADASGVVGLQAGEFRVKDPKTRQRAMQDRVGGAQWLDLEKVVEADVPTLKRQVSSFKLVVVHSQGIDKAGESNQGLAAFDSELQKLRAAWLLLREAGVRRFVITSDHGFLLLDSARGEVVPHGRRIDPGRRHVFSPVAADHDNEVRVPLAALDYDGVSGHVMFPETTALFDIGDKVMTFAHGGNSLQERVIPVLTLVHRAPAGSYDVEYGVRAAHKADFMGLQCCEVRVETLAQQTLAYGGLPEVELALRGLEAPEVSVELCQVRGKARLQGGVVHAAIDETFEVFFRLTGPSDDRVRVEVYHPTAAASVQPCAPPERYIVAAARALAAAPSAPAAAQPGATTTPTGRARDAWLSAIEDARFRAVFAHLEAHGSASEAQVTQLVGDVRAARMFALQCEKLALNAPFGVGVESVDGMKHYKRLD